MKIYPEPALKIGNGTAKHLELDEGDRVRFTTSTGSSEATVSIDESIKDNRVFFSNNFSDNGVFSLLSFNVDKTTKAPGIEGCEVRIRKLKDNKI